MLATILLFAALFIMAAPSDSTPEFKAVRESSLQKQVLLCFNERKHPITLYHDQYKSVAEEKIAILCEAKRLFEVPDEYDEKMIIQMKSEAWGGEFIDLGNEECIPDRSILRIIARQVC